MNNTPKLLLHEIENLQDMDVYILTEGIHHSEKAIKMTPDEVTNEVKKSGASRTRRCRISYRAEMVFHA